MFKSSELLDALSHVKTKLRCRRSRRPSSLSCSAAFLTEVGELACDVDFAYSFRKVPELRKNTEKERMIIARHAANGVLIGCSVPFIWHYPQNLAISALDPPGGQQEDESARFYLKLTKAFIS